MTQVAPRAWCALQDEEFRTRTSAHDMIEEPDRLPLTPFQYRLLRASQQHGATIVIGAITCFSVVVSVSITGLSVLGMPVDRSFALTALALATFIPMLVAPLASSAIVQLAHVVADAHAKLQVQASTDALTGIANRRRFFELAPQLLSGAQNGAIVGMLDVDRFKQINDLHGHAAGDGVLVVLARRLRHAVGAKGLVARVGGDEFALLVPVDDETRSVVIDALHHACRDIEIDGCASVNASLGIEVVSADSALDEAMNLADQALYDSKAMNRRSGGGVHILRSTRR